MTDSLENLKSGKLIGAKRLKLSCGLTSFPEEILTLADTLEVLDLSDNLLTELPDSIAKLKCLKILFVSQNKLSQFPLALKKCTALTMIGIKSNQIEVVPENAFPPKLQWLILTDNKIKGIPKSIGDCSLLQKCALAGNLIEQLPFEMSNCTNLELLRISANKLTSIPSWLFELPRLSWLAFGGNPISFQPELETDIKAFNWTEFEIKNLIGKGASGLIYKALWANKNKAVAVKVFKGAVTSDGLPDDEMQISIVVGRHDNLIPILGKITNHPEAKSGLIMKLITSNYTDLCQPPSLETCTRDVFDNNKHSIDVDAFLNIAKSIVSVSLQLHDRGVNHGDLYGHNILVDEEKKVLLGDFGAATLYDVDSSLAHNIQRIEVRAYGCLLDDLFCGISKQEVASDIVKKIERIIQACMVPEVKSRPSFSEVLTLLDNI